MAGSWQNIRRTLLEIADFLATAYDNASTVAASLEAVVHEERAIVKHLEEIVDACKVKLEHDTSRAVMKSHEEDQQKLERLDEVLQQARRLREVSLKPASKKKRPPQGSSSKAECARPSMKTLNPPSQILPGQRLESEIQHRPSLQLPQLPDDFLKLMADYQKRCTAGHTTENCELQQSKAQFLSDLSGTSGANDQGDSKVDTWSKSAAVIESIALLLKAQANALNGSELGMDPIDLVDLWRDVSAAVKELDRPPADVRQIDVLQWRNRALRVLLSNTNGSGRRSDTPRIPEEVSTVWLPYDCWKTVRNPDRIRALLGSTKPLISYSNGAQLEKLQESREVLQRVIFNTYLESHFVPKLIVAANDQHSVTERRAALCRLAHQFLSGHPPKCAILRPIGRVPDSLQPK